MPHEEQSRTIPSCSSPHSLKINPLIHEVRVFKRAMLRSTKSDSEAFSMSNMLNAFDVEANTSPSFGS